MFFLLMDEEVIFLDVFIGWFYFLQSLPGKLFPDLIGSAGLMTDINRDHIQFISLCIFAVSFFIFDDLLFFVGCFFAVPLHC